MINNEINVLENINIKKGSIDLINKKYTKLNRLKVMKNKLIQEDLCL